MRLRKPCREHNKYEPHLAVGYPYPAGCPGGEFLPEDAIVIEKVEGKWPAWAQRSISDHFLATDALDALADQVGEPG